MDPSIVPVNSAIVLCPFALRKHDLVRVIDEMFWSGNILKNANASRSWASLYLVGHALFFEE